MAREREASWKFAFRNPASAASATYENVVRGVGEKDIRGRMKSRVGRVASETARGSSLFYEVELRRTILSPAKWPGSIFETFPLGPHLSPCLFARIPLFPFFPPRHVRFPRTA